MSREEAQADFWKRIKQYESVYETIESFEWQGWEGEEERRLKERNKDKDEKRLKSPSTPMEEPVVSTESAESKRLREKKNELERDEAIEEAGRNPGKNNERRSLVTREAARRVSWLKIINVGRQVRLKCGSSDSSLPILPVNIG